MRKDVKRSLFLWPAAASVAITAMSAFTMIEETGFERFHASSVSLIHQVVAMHSSVSAPKSHVELPIRSERGERAMKLPDRIAEVLGVENPTLKAPIRDEQSELAGLVLLPPRQLESPPAVPATGVPRGVLLADPTITNHRLVNQQAIGANALQSLRNRTHVEAFGGRPLFVGPRQPQLRQRQPDVFSPAWLTQPSILAAKNRVLSKRILMRPNTDATTSDRQEPASVPDALSGDGRMKAPATVTLGLSDTGHDDTPAVEAQTDNRQEVDRSPAGWPLTRRLDEQLETLSTIALRDRNGRRDQLVSSSPSGSPIVRWSKDVARTLDELQALPRLGDPRSGVLIDRLIGLGDEGKQQAEALTDREAQIHWLRASHAITRRVAVWRPVWQVTNGSQSTWMVGDDPDEQPISVQDALADVRHDLDSTGDFQGWTNYLLLDEIENASQPDQVEQRTILAQRFLSRLYWHGLDAEQQRWLKSKSITQLAAAVLPWARRAVDYANLLSQIERQENDAIDLAAIQIADAVQTLRFAANPQANSVAEAINTYYRNANVRLALSDKMLKRLLPTIDPLAVPVRTQLFGSRVRGTSRIESDLDVKFKPSPDQWSLELKTLGKVHTRSTGVNGAVAIRTAGDANFVASTPINVTRQGVQIGGSDVEVDGRTNLRGIRTDYDGWPLIGSLVRSIASNRYDSISGPTSRIANQQIQSQVGSEIHSQIDDRMGKATQQLSRMVLGPLGKLELDPRVMDMQTTDQRLLARYRVAGDWQLGAFTPRPRALSSSLMSVQIHQSALNNTLEQLVPRGQPMSIHQMLNESAVMFAQSDMRVPDDIPENVTVQFARTRPITVEIEEGRLWVTLRVVRLRRDDRVDLTNFIVRAAYQPQMQGLQAWLVRDGHLRISGPGMSMRERLPVRAIFNKVLSPNRPFQLTLPKLNEHPAMESLAVSQLELRDGWIGLAISTQDAPRIALQHTAHQDK